MLEILNMEGRKLAKRIVQKCNQIYQNTRQNKRSLKFITSKSVSRSPEVTFEAITFTFIYISSISGKYPSIFELVTIFFSKSNAWSHSE